MNWGDLAKMFLGAGALIALYLIIGINKAMNQLPGGTS